MISLETFIVPSFLKIKDLFERPITIGSPTQRKDVYLLGQGWFAKGFMEHINKSRYQVTNITRFPFVNTPMLLQTVKPGLASESMRVGKFTRLIDKEIFDNVSSINLETKEIVTFKSKYSWDGGYLVCGLGSNTDIGSFWTEKINLLQKSKPNSNICIVGAGPTGTELGFHLSDLGHKITLFDGLPQVYTFLTPEGSKHIIKKLETTGIELHTNRMFSPNDKANFDQVIFAVGSRSNDLTSGWKITPQLNLETNPEVFAGGDCVGLLGLPKTAQVAYQQGEYVAKKLNAIGTNKEFNEDFKFVPKGTALYTGKGEYYIEFTKDIRLTIPELFVTFYYKWLK